MDWQQVLVYAIPPTAGAVIGYVTNALAIRMLFRPLREYRIGPVRIPFTPGIIPRQRARLADSIARMVGTTLLTPDTLVAHLQRPQVKQAVHERVRQYTGELLQSRILESRNTEQPDYVSTIVIDVISSESFPAVVRGTVSLFLRSVAKLRVGHVVPHTDIQLEEWIQGIVARIREARGELLARHIVRGSVGRFVLQNTPIKRYVPDTFIDQAALFADRHYDEIWQRILHWLRQPVVQHELAVRGRVLLQRILKRLKFMQRFFVSAGQYDKTLDEQMPQIVRDVVQQLEHTIATRETRELMLHEVRVLLTEIIDCTPKQLENKLGVVWERVADRLLINVFRETALSSADRLTLVMKQFLNGVRNISVGDVLRSVYGESSQVIEDNAVAAVLKYVGASGCPNDQERRAAVSVRVAEWRRHCQQHVNGRSLGSLLFLNDTQKESVDSFITEKFFRIAEAKLPDVVNAVDFESLVRNKVNDLEMLQVEQLLLMVMQRHLKYINIFGALLGAMIGAAQVFLWILL